MKMDKETLRNKIIDSICEQGFTISADGLEHDASTKNLIRNMHAISKNARDATELKFLRNSKNNVRKYFANGSDVDLKNFSPVILPIFRDNIYADIFRFATSFWSIPVSRGFGRRQRFLVIDESNNKLVGLFALGDPVFNLSARDSYIGWTPDDRKLRLYNVMDIFVLGAVPPYSNLLCGKLVAMLSASNEVRQAIYNKYNGTTTNIQGGSKDPTIAFLTTTSALGRSSLYNRIKFNGKLLYNHIGKTKGWGHFHFHNNCDTLIEHYLKENKNEYFKKYNFGDGPNWKIRMLRIGLKELGLPQSLLQHKISRELYGVITADNYIDFLKGKDKHPKIKDLPAVDLIDYFKERWFHKRAANNKSYLQFTCNSLFNFDATQE